MVDLEQLIAGMGNTDAELAKKILQEFARRDREERIREFTPLDPTMAGHKGHKCNDQKGFLYSPAIERWVFGGNRSGKTECTCVDCVMFCSGIHPIRNIVRKPPVFVRYCAPGYEDGIKRIIHKKLQQIIPRCELRGGSWSKAYSAGERTLYFANGSWINFKSYDQDVNKFGGDDLDAIYGDEAGSRAHWRENKMRLVDRNGYYVQSMTPEQGSITWERKHVRKITDPTKRKYWMFSTYGNSHLSLEGLEEVESSIDDEASKKVKLYGMFVPLSGLVYPSFDENIHCSHFKSSDFPEWWERVWVIDPHTKKEHAMTWAAISPDGDVYFYRCQKMNGTPSDVQAYVKVVSLGENIQTWIGDKAQGGDRVDNFGNESFLNMLNSGPNRIPVVGTNQESKDSFKGGVFSVREGLAPHPISGKPSIYFATPQCDGIVDEFYEYQFMPETKTDDLTFRESVRHVYDDYMSCVRYTMVYAKSKQKGNNTKVKSHLSGRW